VSEASSPPVLLIALQLLQLKESMFTDIARAIVASHSLLLWLESETPKLQAYAPTCNALIHPPYEFAPFDLDLNVVLSTEHNVHVDLLMLTDTSFAIVTPHLLVVVLVSASARLQA
jgi:hypothetical protein